MFHQSPYNTLYRTHTIVRFTLPTSTKEADLDAIRQLKFVECAGEDAKIQLARHHTYSPSSSMTFTNANDYESSEEPSPYAARAASTSASTWYSRFRAIFLAKPYHGEGTVAYVLDSWDGAYDKSEESRHKREFGDRVRPLPKSNFTNEQYDPIGHGTTVASLIGGRGSPASKAVIVPIKCIAEKDTNTTSLVMALDAVCEDVHARGYGSTAIVNLSLGPLHELPDEVIYSLKKNISFLHDRGILCVFAAGNNGRDARATNDFARLAMPNTIFVGAVSASDPDDHAQRHKWKEASYSTTGTLVEILAEGTGTMHTGSRFMTATGTSFAAPRVSAVILQIMSAIKSPTEPSAGTTKRILLALSIGNAITLRQPSSNLLCGVVFSAEQVEHAVQDKQSTE